MSEQACEMVITCIILDRPTFFVVSYCKDFWPWRPRALGCRDPAVVTQTPALTIHVSIKLYLKKKNGGLDLATGPNLPTFVLEKRNLRLREGRGLDQGHPTAKR